MTNETSDKWQDDNGQRWPTREHGPGHVELVDAAYLNALEERARENEAKAKLCDEIASRLKMHRVGSLTADPCPLITQLETPGDWLFMYDQTKREE